MREWTRRGVLVAGAASALSACTPGNPSAPTRTSGSPSTTSTAHPSSPAPGGPTRADWRQLRRSVQGHLALPSDARYDRVRLLENPRFDGQRPLAVLSVESAHDVATGLAFAQDHRLPIAVRSGGHSYPGWSGGGTPPALVIDCRPINGVQVTGGTVTIGSGARLVSAYDAVSAQGQAIAGGSCATVGIGGLTLGGGVGVLTRAMGLTCDSVLSMEVVTPDRRVRTVSSQQDPDLFWALRGGGGGHLGVVTSFMFATRPAPTVNTVYLQWPTSAAAEVIDAWQQWAPHADNRLWSTLKLLGGRKHTNGPIVLLSGTWIGPSGRFDHHLAGLLDHVPIPSVSSRRTRSYRDAMMAYAECSSIPVGKCHTGPGGALDREEFSATSHVMYDELDASGISDLLGHVEGAQSSGLLEAGVSLDALGGAVGDLGPTDTAFVHRTASATVQYTATFPPGSPRQADHYVRGFRRAMLPHWGNHAYVNYADATIRDYRAAYFGKNAKRLAEVDRTYDPDGFFTQPQGF